MKFKHTLSAEEKKLFKQAVSNTAQLKNNNNIKNDENTTQDSSSNSSDNNQQAESQLFSQSMASIKPLIQDKTPPAKKIKAKISQQHQKNSLAHENPNKQNAEFYFSDEFEPHLNSEGPTKYVRDGVDSFEVKKLRRGHYSPDLILDLHGLNQIKAKQEIAAILYACQKEHAQCICIVHGLGARTLKTKVPHWLVQHPNVMAFHQATLEWGGNGALLVLVELKDKFID
jgi:DNA-nicking Smr family endonuclease